MKDSKIILSEVLSERSANNPSYSLRAFARDLEVSPQLLSNVINGKRGFGKEAADRISKKLDLSEFERMIFKESFKAKFSRSKVERVVAHSKLNNALENSTSKNLEIDLFKAISNWYHFTLLELIKISKPKTNNSDWYATKLNIPEQEVINALERLERLELVSKAKKGWVVNQDTIIAEQGISSESVRNFHKQILEKASHALLTQTSFERYGSSSTIPIKVKNVEKAKKLIQDFRLKFDRELSDTEDGEEIYGLSLQFFRLTNK